MVQIFNINYAQQVGVKERDLSQKNTSLWQPPFPTKEYVLYYFIQKILALTKLNKLCGSLIFIWYIYKKSRSIGN